MRNCCLQYSQTIEGEYCSGCKVNLNISHETSSSPPDTGSPSNRHTPTAGTGSRAQMRSNTGMTGVLWLSPFSQRSHQDLLYRETRSPPVMHGEKQPRGHHLTQSRGCFFQVPDEHQGTFKIKPEQSKET